MWNAKNTTFPFPFLLPPAPQFDIHLILSLYYPEPAAPLKEGGTNTIFNLIFPILGPHPTYSSDGIVSRVKTNGLMGEKGKIAEIHLLLLPGDRSGRAVERRSRSLVGRMLMMAVVVG